MKYISSVNTLFAGINGINGILTILKLFYYDYVI